MVVLKLEDILARSNKFPVSTSCLCQTYSKQPTKTGGAFIGGTLSFKEGTIPFKSWSNSSAFDTLSDKALSGVVVEIEGEVNEYQGTKSIIVSAIREVPKEVLNSIPLTASDFLSSKYNSEKWYEAYMSYLEKNLSEKAYSVFESIMGDEEVKSRFCTEFAASFYHDACRGGLLAHSLKVTQAASLVKKYPNLMEKISTDLLYFGCAIHDIGKIREYNNGVMSQEGLAISHNVSGILFLEQYKDKISNTLGDDFYTGLCSIISGHHGEAGEPPRTVAAYVVHILDYAESRLAGMEDLLARSEDGRIVFDGFKLS